MKTLAISLIIATMAATLCVACVELVNVESSMLFIKFFWFVSLLLIDVYALIAILRNRGTMKKIDYKVNERGIGGYCKQYNIDSLKVRNVVFSVRFTRWSDESRKP